jgi:protein MpaA
VRQIDNPLAQDLLDRFLRAGATSIFVGPHTKLHGPRKIVMQLVDHDNHMHVRIAKENRRTVYGRSEDGRPLRAVELGFPGPEKVLVIGCIHGTECAGTAVVRRLARSMPPLFDLWAVPNLNPDGTAAGTRQNGRGVDLNRNFPSGWTARGRRWSTQFSGRRPLSERETRFAARLIRRLRPRVTIWFHQHEDRVRAWGESIPSARRYARIAAMRFAPVRWPAGSASNWQNHSFPGASSFVVELPAGRLSPSVIESQVRAILRSGE